MKRIFLILFLVFSLHGFSQIEGEDEIYLTGDLTEAKFQGGGLDKFYDYVIKESDFSMITTKCRIVASFTIDIDGSLKRIKMLEYPNSLAAAEMIRVLNKSPKWESAKRHGKPVSIEMKIPLVFK